ncbi:MAG: hypothetical protein AAGI45_07920 [Cyanobacteria bacterium P01_H01_bin.26]
MPVDNTLPVLDLKPLEYNPFLDGTIVYDLVDGTMVPRSATTAPPPVSNPYLDSRPSHASTQSLIDSAQSFDYANVRQNAAALRGYETTDDAFDIKTFERGLDNLSEADLDRFADELANQASRRAAEAKAVAPRITAQQALRRGAQVAGALGSAIDAYNVANAILDPTNNPLDEIGDVAGSMLGGALGASLGPVGALGGSLVGGWLGRQLGNLLQGERNPQGYQSGVTLAFTVDWSAITNICQPVHRTNRPYTWEQAGPPPYAIENADTTPNNNCPELPITRGFHLRASDGQLSPVFSPHVGFTRVTFSDRNTEPFQPPRQYPNFDTPEPSRGPSGTTAAPRVNPTNYSPRRLRDPMGQPPTLTGPDDLTPDSGDYPTLPRGGPPKYEDPPVPDNLPQPRLQPITGPTLNPNPERPCCELNALTLEHLLTEVEAIQAHFQSSGVATLNLTACGDTTPSLLPWTGSGLAGLYRALETLSEATNQLWAQVKCPPETTAATPMVWETKVQTHAQLIVLWAPTEGGSSRWAMHIPHPRSMVQPGYRFRFPAYTKGSVRGTLRLADNSRVVVNGQSEAECKKVLAYARGLIIPTYLDGAQQVFTKGTANFGERSVKAVYVKAFAGHRDLAPLWVKRLT